MEEFNLSKINLYSIDELVEFILSDSTTQEQLYKNGLFRLNRPLLEKALEVRDEEDWCNAKDANSLDSFSAYLSQYDKIAPHYSGRHVEEAKELSSRFVIVEDKRVEVKNPIVSSDIENEDNRAELSSLLSTLIFNSNKRELSLSDNASWLKATSMDTIDSYEEYLRIYKNNTWGYIGKHIKDAEQKILHLQEATDWLQTTTAKTETAYNKYISKYEPIKHLLTSNHIDEAKKRLTSHKATQWSKFVKNVVKFVSLCVVACLCVWVYKYFTKPKSLSPDEIAEIIKEKQDSLKIDLFDGFCLIPAIKGQGEQDIAVCSEIESDINSSATEYIGPTSKDEVLANYVSTLNGKYNVANKDGVILELPEAQNGIDSICVKSSPFIEYIDNNGLRRIVGLFNDDLYFYLGECGFTPEGKKRYILSNRNNRIGMIDSDLRIIHDFTNDGIYPVTPNGYCISNDIIKYFGNTGQPIAYQNYSSSLYLRKRNYPANKLLSYQEKFLGPYGFKNMDNQVIIPAKFKDVSEFNDDGYAAVGMWSTPNKGYCDKWGVINSEGELIIPMEYNEIRLSRSGPILARQNSLWGYIDYDNNQITDFKFKDARIFEGTRKLAPVLEYGQYSWGYINTDGEYEISPRYSRADLYTVLPAVWSHSYLGGNEKLNETAAKCADTYSFDSYTLLGRVRYKGVEWYINTNGAFCCPAIYHYSELKPSDQNIQAQIAQAQIAQAQIAEEAE